MDPVLVIVLIRRVCHSESSTDLAPFKYMQIMIKKYPLRKLLTRGGLHDIAHYVGVSLNMRRMAECDVAAGAAVEDFLPEKGRLWYVQTGRDLRALTC